MASLSDYAENELLDHLLGTGSFTMPSQVYVALYTTATDDGSGGTEVTNANAYARTAVDFDAASGGATDATADVVFPTASGSWGTVTHIALTDSATHGGGNRLMHAALAVSKAVDNGDTFRILAADLDVSLT